MDDSGFTPPPMPIVGTLPDRSEPGAAPMPGSPVLLTDAQRRRLDQIRAYSRLLDTAFKVPGTNWRFGLDPILGLFPGIGDLVGLGLSGWIVLEAARMGVPKSVVARMLYNVAMDEMSGTIPVIGDLYDFAYKANKQNLDLLDRHLQLPEQTEKSSRRLVIAIVVVAFAVLATVVVLVGLLLKAILTAPLW